MKKYPENRIAKALKEALPKMYLAYLMTNSEREWSGLLDSKRFQRTWEELEKLRLSGK